MQNTRKNNAFALSIVLWIVAAILLGIAFTVKLSKNQLDITKLLESKLQTRLQAESVLEILKFTILTSNFNSSTIFSIPSTPIKLPTKIILDGRDYNIDDNITFSLLDTSSLLNVFSPLPSQIASLATNNNQKSLYFTIRDSTLDWIDTDNIERLNGAEESFYHLHTNKNFTPRNSPDIQGIEELKLIHGIDQFDTQDWQHLKKYLYYGNGATLNLFLADQYMLEKILHLNPIDAQALFNNRNFQEFYSKIIKNPYYNEYLMGFALSLEIKLHIEVSKGSSRSIIETLIDFRPSKAHTFTVEEEKIY